MVLQTENLQIRLCSCLAEARKAIGKEGFDLVILDINLPDGNGLDFLSELRKSSTVPVIRRRQMIWKPMS